MNSTPYLRLPDQLSVTGNCVADNWRRFREQWENYEIASDVAEASAAKRAAIFLNCIGGEAYDVYRSLPLSAEQRKDVTEIIQALENFCVGSVNITYERYVFYQRAQETNERFDTFLGDLRRLAKSCQFDGMEDSMIRDRVVMGVKEDATRHKLLQTRDLTLSKAIDICKASEAAGQQLRAMTAQDHVQALRHTTRSDTPPRPTPRPTSRPTPSWSTRSPPPRSTSTPDHRTTNDRTGSQAKCRNCGRQHDPRRCPAYGQTCNRCFKKSHFAAVCQSRPADARRSRPEVCELDLDERSEDEVVMALDNRTSDRWHARLKVGKKTVRFLLDSGATVNLIPAEVVTTLGQQKHIRPAKAVLRMFDKSELPTTGMVTLSVNHPVTQKRHALDFYVAARHQQPILGFEACRDLKLLSADEESVCVVTPINQATCLTEAEVRDKYADLFTGVGLLEGDVHLELDDKVKPVQMPLRKLPLGVRESVQAELQRLEDLGIIIPVSEPTPWVSALLVVKKPDGRIRVCIDPQPLNKALMREQYYMPTIEDILPQLAGARVFSTVDAKDGFWHLRLDEASSRLTTFDAGAFGRFRWARLPFGISPSPEIFQSRIHAALAGLKGIACIADDIIIFGSGPTEEAAMQDHNSNLRALLERCRTKGIKLNPKKIRLNRESTIFCGHELTKTGVKPDPRKIEAIANMPPPSDRPGVMRLLGMATYLAKFCPNFSEITGPIRSLLKGENEFCWRPEIHGQALQKLKTVLSSAPVLAYFDTTKAIVVQCDASQAGLGAVLLQAGRPVEYASRALTPTEQNWAQIEKEQGAILFALERFHTYVYARHITIETDHKPLIAIAKKPLASAPTRLQRMLLRLQRYTYTLVYTPGSQVILADTLSRAYPPPAPNDTSYGATFTEEIAELKDDQQLQELSLVASQETINALLTAAEADQDYQLLIQQINTGWPPTTAQIPEALRPYSGFTDELVTSGGLAFKGKRVIIPGPARHDILQRLHSSHIGVNGCIRRAQETVYYPSITSHIKEMVGRCEICSRYQTETQKEPLLPHPAPLAHGIKSA
jgi:RNase H-like domain found in reverse transcriptase/Reverse transcriptase (RNA-dependent DNA polymerase)/Integrase zinc binding domain